MLAPLVAATRREGRTRRRLTTAGPRSADAVVEPDSSWAPARAPSPSPVLALPPLVVVVVPLPPVVSPPVGGAGPNTYTSLPFTVVKKRVHGPDSLRGVRD